MATIACPSEDRLCRWLLGRCDESDLEVVASHLDECPDCERVIQVLESRSDTLINDLYGVISAVTTCQRDDGPPDTFHLTGSPVVGHVPAIRGESISTTDTAHTNPPGHSSRNETHEPSIRLGREDVGAIIAGKYKLIEKIGEGGMGKVFLADQTKPVVRQVALKLTKLATDSKTVSLRFESERQALAMMDHPNIARVFDGGTTASGQPFFVMEFVRGVPITQYCDERRLTLNARLELFGLVCQAVQHAHQKGIIHRDIKPKNVLVAEVDGSPKPKVIDFGIAKAIEHRLTDETISDVGVIVGTPNYMSPEQADPSSIDIDTRTDVYALGVLLYELLAGSPPFDAALLARGSIVDMMRIVREVEPLRPSTKLSKAADLPGIAARRDIEPGRLLKWLRGDIGWIVMKALEKDRERRYATANGLAADIERFLAYQPVVARAPSRGSLLRKFIRRNRGAVIAASLVSLALIGGGVGTAIGLIEARTQAVAAKQALARALAEAEGKERARKAEAEQRALAEDAHRRVFDALKLFTDDLMEKLLGGKVNLSDTEKAILRNAHDQWEGFARSSGDSAEARVIRADGAAQLARIQHKLGLHAAAETNGRAALKLRQELAAEFPDNPLHQFELAIRHHALASRLADMGNRTEAETNFRQAVEISGRLAAAFPAEKQYRRSLGHALIGLANVKRERKQWDEAERHYRDALVVQKQLSIEDPTSADDRDDEADSHWGLAFTYRREAKPRDESEREYRTAIKLKEELANEFPADTAYRYETARLRRELGSFLSDHGNDEEGAAFLVKAVEALDRLVTDFPSMPAYRHELVVGLFSYGQTLGYLKAPVEATERFQRAIAEGEKLVCEYPAVLRYHQSLGLSYGYFANMLRDDGKPVESLEWYHKAIRILEPAYQRDRLDDLIISSLYKCHRSHARALNLVGKYAEAILECDHALEIAPPSNWPEIRAIRTLSRMRVGMFAPALADLEELTKSDSADCQFRYDLARGYALACAKDPAKNEKFAEQALQQLQDAVKAGFKETALLAGDQDLDSLRDRNDFKRLRADLEKRFPPKLAPSP